MRTTAEATALGTRHRGKTQPDCTFYLGTHQPVWLARVRFPLFVSHRRLRRYRQLPIARCRWALDSGAFSELATYGAWREAPEAYVAAVRRYQHAIGHLVWAAPQDWMCEPQMVAKTGLSVLEHQWRTVSNFKLLRRFAPDLPFVPVIQGWRLADYLHCLTMYAEAGIDLATEPLVGLGSVCRRQDSDEIEAIVLALHDRGLRLHGFGVKVGGLQRYGRYLASADSMAWSMRGRQIHGCHHRRQGERVPVSEANCLLFARSWRRRLLAQRPSSVARSGGPNA